MLDILFSFQFVWIALIIILLSTGVAILCVYLHAHLLQVIAGTWLTDHIYCPVVKTMILVIMTLLLFPLMVQQADYSQVFNVFVEREYLTQMLNILFVSGLLISFIPLLQHPAMAMPLLGCIATAILFNSYFSVRLPQEVALLPDFTALLKILLLMFAIYWLNRWIIDQFSSYIDHRFIITGSRELVADIAYLILQIPVMLAYAHSLNLQNSISATT